MLIAISKYTKPLSEVDVYRPAHHQYIKPLFASGELLIAGRQNPPLGGVIIAKTESIEKFKEILDNDPFTKAGVAEYEIITLIPSFYDQILNEIIECK
jgi:uncharacterized protein YciI